MTYPEQRILDFIGEHHILTLAISRGNQPYCATCYYAYLGEQNQFIFTSDHDTRHIRDVVEGNNYRVAGTIALETKIVGKIRGIQFTGFIRDLRPADADPAESPAPGPALQGREYQTARARYLKRFPIARLMPNLHLWSLTPDYIKMTDNRLGFGKKLIWTPEESRKSG
ncbi:MAG: hypothetical protein NT040_02840 [Bacteroidetes bacterium]|nr:hypothetical protein [Bacteroidota bacterium]